MERQWQGNTDGSGWMQRQLINCFRFLNIRLYYVAVALVVPFYMLFGKGFGPSYRYFRRIRGERALTSLWHSYKNHLLFGMVMIDRFAAYAGIEFKIEVIGQEIFDKYEASPEPLIILSSHTGCYEMGGYRLKSSKKRHYALVYAGETETVMENRKKKFAATGVEMIPLREDMSHLFEINSALRDGEIVSMPADRCHGSDKQIRCTLLGAPAALPAGPFTVIAQRSAHTLAIFVMKSGVYDYRLYVKSLPLPEEGLPRRERVQILADGYSAAIEEILKEYPCQWFNFYDFWDKESRL